jgi:hypothetical protein
MEILVRLIDDLRAIPRCEHHDPCVCQGDCECDADGGECPTFSPVVDALMEAENELDRARLITRDITEAA